jgi:hypothetical protein
MTACEQKNELQERLKAAFEEWHAVKDVPGKTGRLRLPRRRFTTFSVR